MREWERRVKAWRRWTSLRKLSRRKNLIDKCLFEELYDQATPPSLHEQAKAEVWKPKFTDTQGGTAFERLQSKLFHIQNRIEVTNARTDYDKLYILIEQEVRAEKMLRHMPPQVTNATMEELLDKIRHTPYHEVALKQQLRAQILALAKSGKVTKRHTASWRKKP